MGRYRSRSRSYSPRRVSRSPPRRKRYDDPRDRYRGGSGGGGGGRSYRRSSPPSGLLIRNIALDARPDDLRIPFERFGPVKDVYLPKNYYTGEPRGFGFVKFRNADDAVVAKQEMNHQVIGGREISIVFADENRKTPKEMRLNSRVSDRHNGGDRRRSPPRSPRRRHHSYSRSPSPPRRDLRDRDRSSRDVYLSPERSISPARDEREYRSNHRSQSPRKDRRGPSMQEDGQSPSRSRSLSPR